MKTEFILVVCLYNLCGPSISQQRNQLKTQFQADNISWWLVETKATRPLFLQRSTNYLI